ncbi:hypothetical protein ACFX2K_028030 [Malus domestica]
MDSYHSEETAQEAYVSSTSASIRNEAKQLSSTSKVTYSIKAPCYKDCEEYLSRQQPSRPQIHQSERGQSNSCEPLEQCENVGYNVISTQRSSIPITMCDLFPENFFNYLVKAHCYKDSKERLSQIA